MPAYADSCTNAIQQSNRQLEKVTTPSFRALQLYSRAYEHSYRRQWPVTEQLLREAIDLDPDFASAYLVLATALRNQDKIRESYAYDQKALELAPTTSERERYYIIGTHHMARARHRKAAEVFQVLADLYPDHYWAHQNLTFMLPMQGRYKEAFNHARRAAELRPQDFYALNQAARLVVTSGATLEETRQYVERVRQLIPDDLPKNYGHRTQWILYEFPAYAAWMEGDLAGVLREIDRLKAIPEHPNGFRNYRAFLRITLGQLEKAAELLAAHHRRPCSQSSVFLAWIREDDEALRELLRPCMGPLPMEPKSPVWANSLLLRTGLLPPNQVRLKYDHEPSRLSLEAEIALAAGRTDTGIALLSKAFDLYPSNTLGIDGFNYFWMAESLASILEKQGRWTEAARILERVSDLRYRALNLMGRSMWLRTQWQLSQLYRRLGLEEEAKEIESDLRQLLAYADLDHPIRSRLPVEVARAGNVPVGPARELPER